MTITNCTNQLTDMTIANWTNQLTDKTIANDTNQQQQYNRYDNCEWCNIYKMSIII